MEANNKGDTMDKYKLIYAWLQNKAQEPDMDSDKAVDALIRFVADGTLDTVLVNFTDVAIQRTKDMIAGAENQKLNLIEQATQEKAALETLKTELSAQPVEPIKK